jgi:hypothetical protein
LARQRRDADRHPSGGYQGYSGPEWLPIGAMMPAASARLRTMRQASPWVMG